MLFNLVKECTCEGQREYFKMSPQPKGVLSLMFLGQVRECPYEGLKEYSRKSPQPKRVFGLMLLGQVRVYLKGSEKVLQKVSFTKGSPGLSQKVYLWVSKRVL